MIKRNSLVYMLRAALCAALIAVSSFVTLPLGAVPVTLQTFVVCAASAILGFKWGFVSVLVYIFLGALGLPVFSGFGGGLGVLLGAGGGYIFGFLLVALIVGLVSDRTDASFGRLAVAMAVGVASCYLVGTLWYVFVYSGGEGVMAALATCVFPFVLPDAVKIIAAATVASRLKKRI